MGYRLGIYKTETVFYGTKLYCYVDSIKDLKTWLNSDIQSILNELDLIVKNQNQLIDYLESKEKGE